MSKEKIKQIIGTLTSAWKYPKVPPHILAANPESHFLCQCTAERTDEIISDNTLPPDVLNFWSLYKSANLFLEVRSQIYGLKLLSYREAKVETGKLRSLPYSQYEDSDLVIGQFMGYPDHLVVRCDPQAADFGTILVAIYDGFRNEWYRVANNFTEFLERYVEAEGESYW